MTESRGQGILLSGVSEGGILILSAGATKTNLAVTAQGEGLSGSVVFALERQGTQFMTLTAATPYSVTFSNLTIGKYFLSAGGGGGLSGDLSFDVKASSSRPPNDDWAHAENISGVNLMVVGSNVFATSEPGEIRNADVGIGKSVWWSWVAPSDGLVSATTKGSSFDTALGVYVGTSLNELQEIVANDDVGPNSFSQVTFTASAGKTYFFAVDGGSANGSGDVKLRIVPATPPLISFGGQTNWFAFFVNSNVGITNAVVPAAFNDASGVAQVNYWLAGPNLSASGTAPSPYQISFPNLAEGSYSLTLVASNNVDLVSSTNIGFSVVSMAPELVLENFNNSGAQYQFGVLGLQGSKYGVEVSSNLLAWLPAVQWNNFSGAEIVNGTNAPSKANQFYRAVLK